MLMVKLHSSSNGSISMYNALGIFLAHSHAVAMKHIAKKYVDLSILTAERTVIRRGQT